MYISRSEREEHHKVKREHEREHGGGKRQVDRLGRGPGSRATKSRRVPAGVWSSVQNRLTWLRKFAKMLNQSLVHSTLGETEIDGDLGVAEEKEARGALEPDEEFGF